MFKSVIGKLSFCSRRQQDTSTSTANDVASYINKKLIEPKPFYDSDAGKSTDYGVDENSDFSDHFNGSSDWSDTEMRTLTATIPKDTPTRAPPGLAPPPGLQAPPGLEAPPTPSDWLNQGIMQSPGKRLNSQAAAFVPSFATQLEVNQEQNNAQQLRQSIRRVKEALEQWEAEHVATPLAGSVEDNTFSALRDALSKLSPKEAAQVRSFLDSKDAGANAAYMYGAQVPACFGNFPSAGVPPGHFRSNQVTPTASISAHRPFTPFGVHQTKPNFPQSQKPRTATSKKQTKASQEDGEEESLATILRDLAQLDSARVVMVRKINRLGLESAAALESYFSRFGTLERVMVSHSRSKSTFGQTRLRPATLGFLLMSSADEVQAILAAGGEHMINDIPVIASPFESHPVDSL